MHTLLHSSLLACTIIVYVQDSVSWALGFALPAAAMAAALLLFLAGSSSYRHVAPTESPMARVAKVVAAALRARWRAGSTAAGGGLRGPREDEEPPAVLGGPGGYGPDDAELASLLGSSRGRGYGSSRSAGALSLAPRPGAPQRGTGSRQAGAGGRTAASGSFRWLEDAISEWQTSQGQTVLAGGIGRGHGGYTAAQVEEVKLVLRLLPVFVTTIIYWCVTDTTHCVAPAPCPPPNALHRPIPWVI